ncbi:hypothetical protein [Peteryoungia desertarenae]|uniref:hypothetical protein n=1 Tax=Peteryoungia desertarenae TaxID=1813451 RepID=UPI001FE3BC50|nr:hypothetical protein [Peteryoungia desertarenae]
MSILVRHKPVLKPVLEPFCLCRLSGRNGGQFSPVFKVPFEERDHLIEMDPDTFFTTDHHRPHQLVLARPERLDLEWARENLTRVWRAQAKKAVVKAWDAIPSFSP